CMRVFYAAPTCIHFPVYFFRAFRAFRGLFF
ncbi:MAG: hypothetical protein RIR39_1035, partial [Pseudomonadota bacterium]